MNLISLKDLSKEYIEDLMDKAVYYKENYEKYYDTFKGKKMLLLFEKTSTRTRVSFEAGFSMMGGHPIYLDSQKSNLVLSELKDEIRYITRNVDIIMARMLKHKDILTIADYASVPVINGCCDYYHPCQILADILTMKETFGHLEGLSVTYVGVINNVCNDLIAALPKLGIKLYVVAPLKEENLDVDGIIPEAQKTGNLILTDDLEEAVKNSDVVYTDTWINMEYFNNPEFKEQNEAIVKKMLPYQINSKVLEYNPSIKIMHDMPIHEGYEISREAIEHKNSIIFQQGGNRMWAQNTLVLNLFNKF